MSAVLIEVSTHLESLAAAHPDAFGQTLMACARRLRVALLRERLAAR